MLQIWLLGEFHLVYTQAAGPGQITPLNTPRLQSLLAYLILHRNAPQPRRQIAFALWPDLPESRARANLRKLFHQLQQALPNAPHFLSSDTQTLQWWPDAPFWSDVAEFETAVARAASPEELRQATELYGGDLLPSCYEDWIIPERERLRQKYTEAMERLAQWAEDERDYRAAIHYARCLLQLDPLREEIHRALIRLHALNGDRAAALRAYHACVTVLQRELGVEPAPATREMYERLFNEALASEAAAAPTAVTFPLVGRAREWDQLLAAWRAAAAGRPHLALLTGEAGIGKTRLAEELVAWLNRQGIAAAAAHCYFAEGALPYAPVVAWLRARPLPKLEPVWLSELARLLPELATRYPDLPAPGPLTEAWQRQRLHEALARAALGGGAPLLLLIEDLQWCGRDTLEWLRYLLRFDARARLLVLGTYRSEDALSNHPLTELLAALRRDRQLAEISLGPLDAGSAAQLAACAAGQALDAETAACLYQETEGNPLFIVEMARAGLAGEPCADPRSLPSQVQAVLSARLAQLSPLAADLVGAAATIGREFTFDTLKLASGLDEETLVRGLDELWQRRIVRERGESAYDFGHGKLREAAYAGLSAARKRLLHRRVAEALEAAPASDLESISASIAAHYERANLPERAIPCYRRAAQAARRVYANEKALAFLTRALELTPLADWIERYELLLARAQVYDLMGERQAQSVDLDTMIQLAQAKSDLPRLAQARRQQAWMFIQTSRFDQAEQSAQETLALAQQLDDPGGQAAALTAWGTAAYLRGDAPRAALHLQKAIQLAQAAGDVQSEAEAREAMVNIQAKTGEHIAARAQVEATLLLRQQANDLSGYAQQLGRLAALLNIQGEVAAAMDACRQAVEICRAIGYRYGEAYALLTWSKALVQQGQIGQAVERFTQTIAICDVIQEQRFGARARAELAGIYTRYIGHYSAAIRAAKAGLSLCRQTGNHEQGDYCLAQLGHAWLHRGKPEKARACLDAALAGQQAAGDRWGEQVTRELLAELELAQGHPQAAIEHLEIAETICRQTGLDSRLSNVLVGRGQTLLALERPVEALAAIDKAAALLTAGSGQTYLVHFWRALALRASNRTELARAALEQAYEILSEMLATLSPGQRQMSLERVPEHRAILAAWQAERPQACSACL